MASYSALASSNLITAAQALKLQAYDKMLQMKSLPESIFFRFGGNVIDKMTPIPSTWILRKSPSGEDMPHQTNFSMLMNLRGQETKGNAVNQLDNIETPILKEFTAYYNDVSHAVALDQYGINFYDTAPYGVKDRVTDLLSTFWKELLDYYMHFAIINKYSPNLLESPINLSTVPHKNTFVKGVYYADQPYNKYNTNSNFFSSVIAATMDLARNNHSNWYELGFDVPFALAIAEWANNTGKLKPFNIGGSSSYIYAIPSSQVTRTLNPMTTDGFGAVWQATSRFQGKEEADLPLFLGKCRNVIFVENPRAPTAVTYGSGSGSGSGVGTTGPTNSVLEVRYLKPGENDQRHTTGNIWEAGILMGQHGMAEVDAGIHTEYELQSFKKIKATGMFNTYGLNRAEFGVDSSDATFNTSTSLDNFSSMVTWFGKQSGYFNDNTVSG